MAEYTDRNVVGFEIHNLTEEKFQELKAAGQINPNAIYMTPDETVVKFDAVNARVGVTESDIAGLKQSKQDIATAVNYDNISNCITEIPQDIKLELNNGTLTLKAGSKVYVPNGSGVFDAVTTTADTSATRTDSQVCMVWRYPSGSLGIFPIQLFYSGATAPTQYQFMFWYDTTNRLCKYTSDSGSTWTAGMSLPICVVETDGTKISAIKQVFNGFGYIGSTIFALPGVKYLEPNGTNADGTLKNIERTLSAVRYMNMESWMAGRTNAPLTLDPVYGVTGMDINPTDWGTVNKLSDIVRPSYYACYYCLEDNLVHYFNGSGVEGIAQRAFIGSFNVDSNNKIISFTPKTVFHAMDYGDFHHNVSKVLDAVYPVGSVYITTSNTNPMATLIPWSKWSLVSSGRALWTGNGSNGNTTIAAGLPNITGSAVFEYGTLWDVTFDGALYSDTAKKAQQAQGENGSSAGSIKLDASKSSSIYGQSTTVQPPAYVVNVWRRVS